MPWDVLRAIGDQLVRALAAVEPRGLNRNAQRNAAAAAALAHRRRLEAEEAQLWFAVRLDLAVEPPGRSWVQAAARG